MWQLHVALKTNHIKIKDFIYFFFSTLSCCCCCCKAFTRPLVTSSSPTHPESFVWETLSPRHTMPIPVDFWDPELYSTDDRRRDECVRTVQRYYERELLKRHITYDRAVFRCVPNYILSHWPLICWLLSVRSPGASDSCLFHRITLPSVSWCLIRGRSLFFDTIMATSMLPMPSLTIKFTHHLDCTAQGISEWNALQMVLVLPSLLWMGSAISKT